jgi:transcriptional regulator with XRE-family HTH domain
VLPDLETQLRVTLIILGKCIQRRRKGRGLSQREFACKAGLSRSEVQFIESAGRDPRYSTIRRCCVALGISINELDAEVERLVSRRLLRLARRV